jgi:hypothetical protein
MKNFFEAARPHMKALLVAVVVLTSFFGETGGRS